MEFQTETASLEHGTSSRNETVSASDKMKENAEEKM